MNEDRKQLAPSRPWFEVLPGHGELLAIAAAACVVWFSPWGFPSSNNVYHLPIVLRYAQSAEGPHDAFHQSLDHFLSFFWPAVSMFATEDNVQMVFLVLLIGASIATVLGAYSLVRATGASRNAAGIGCGVLAFAFGGRQFLEFGNGELLSGFLTHSQVATAVCLFSMALAVRRRWVLASLLCGLAADINLFLGFWTVTHLMLARVSDGWEWRKTFPIGDCVKMAIVCLIAASPAILWALRATLSAHGTADFSFTSFLYEFEPHHSFVHLQLGPLVNFGMLPAILWFCFRDRETTREAALLVRITAAAVATVSCGALLVYLFDYRIVQNLYPLRYAAVAHWIIAAAVVALWADADRKDSPRAFAAAIAVLGFILSSPAVTVLGLLVFADASKTISRSHVFMLIALGISLMVPSFYGVRADAIVERSFGPLPVLTIVSVVGAALIACRFDQAWQERALLTLLLWLVVMTTPFAGVWIAIPLSLLIVAMAALLKLGRQRAITLAVGIVGAAVLIGYAVATNTLDGRIIGTLILSALPLLTVSIPALRLEWRTTTVVGLSVTVLSLAAVLQGARQGFDFPDWQLRQNWVATQQWARANTPPDTLFYSPDRGDFATLSRRPVWWDEKQGAAVMWEPSFHQEWQSRRERAIATRSAGDLVKLARAENIRFLVVTKQRLDDDPLPGTDTRYCNPDFCVAEVIDPIVAAGDVSPRLR